MRVLYVEDDPVNRKVMQAMLSRAGIAIEEAFDGLHGLEMIDTGDYDLVLMDLRMPRMDGLTAIKHIRARADHRSNVPIVVVTADTSETMRADCLREGANDVLCKPVPLQRMMELIASYALEDAEI